MNDNANLKDTQLVRMHEIFFCSDAEFFLKEMPDNMAIEELAEFLEEFPGFIEQIE